MPRGWVKQYFWVFLEEMSIGFSGLSGWATIKSTGGPNGPERQRRGDFTLCCAGTSIFCCLWTLELLGLGSLSGPTPAAAWFSGL